MPGRGARPTRPSGPPGPSRRGVGSTIASPVTAANTIIRPGADTQPCLPIARGHGSGSSRVRDGKLVQDIVSALIYLTAGFAVIAYVFDLPIQGLLATSGVIAIVLGLALQSSLNDVFSGLVLSLSHPYKAGDWIKIDGGTEGRIVELNWRATHILTGRQDLAIVPNSTIAKSKIVNLNYPSAIHGMTIDVRLSAPPASGKNILELALLNSRLILSFPRASVLIQSVDATQTEYEITFFVDRLDSDTDAQNELLDLISRHAVAAGARLAPPKNAPYQPHDDEALSIKELNPYTVLTLAGLFVCLTPDERAAIGANLKKGSHDKGDVLVQPDVVLQSLFIVGSGVCQSRGRTMVRRRKCCGLDQEITLARWDF